MKLRHIIVKILYIWSAATTVLILLSNVLVGGRFIYHDTYADIFLTKYMPETVYRFFSSIAHSFAFGFFLTFINYYCLLLLKAFNKIKIIPFAVIYTLAILNCVYIFYVMFTG